MLNRVSRNFILSVAVSMSLPAITLAASPTTYLERSKVIATGKQIRIYDAPTMDANGKIKYYDIIINVPVQSNGKPGTSAVVKAVLSPKVKQAEFVRGNYSALESTCELKVSAFSGRNEYDLHCTHATYGTFAATWFTGPITGHPYEPELLTAGIDGVPGNSNYAWGRVGFAASPYWFDACFRERNLFSARQVENIITLSNYGLDDHFDCQVNLVKTTP